MKNHRDNEALVNYLLGALTEAELQLLEQRYLGDETLFEELQEIEDELIDDYVGGALDAEQRAQFEQYFLRSPARREKVEFARAITEHALEWKRELDKSPSSPPAPVSAVDSGATSALPTNVLQFNRWSRPVPAWRQWGAIAAALLIAVGSGTLWLRNRELRQELVAVGSNEARLRQEVETTSANAQQLEAKVSDVEQQNRKLQERLASIPGSLIETAGNAIFKTFLSLGEMSLGGTKGGGDLKIKTLDIPANKQWIRLDIEVEKTKYKIIQAALERRGAESPAWASGALKLGNRSTIALKIPGERVSTGDYVLSLNGVTLQGEQTTVGKYYLKVVRK